MTWWPSAATSSESRRGGERPPYPGASTRSSHPPASNTRTARSTRAAAHGRTRADGTTQPPGTVWACGPDPIDPHSRWPQPIVESITTAFTSPGARVLLASTEDERGNLARSTEAAQDTVHNLNRTAETITLNPANTTVEPANRTGGDTTPEGTTPADLIILTPTHLPSKAAWDCLALAVAGRLSRGGILAVYIYSERNTSHFVDPTGPIVAAAQHADLLYLQHIVTLHGPLHASQLQSPLVADSEERTRHHAATRGLPVPHLRAHADLLVFVQPRSHPPTPDPTPDRAAATHAQNLR